jgi:predicted branched-subunit amino acid permease
VASRDPSWDAGFVSPTPDATAHAAPRRDAFRRGLRAGAPYAFAGGAVSLSFGVLAHGAGFPGWAAVLMSAIVFAGSAQFAALSIFAAGGSLPAALGAAALMNSRFLPMGVALAPSLPGGPVKRAAQGQTVVDASWAMAANGDGSFDRWFLFGCTAVQYVTWVSGTFVGVAGGDALGDPHRLGFDAMYPTFFLALLIAEARTGRARGVAAAGAVIALLLVPVAPAGVPVLVGSLAALWGLRGRPRRAARERPQGGTRA